MSSTSSRKSLRKTRKGSYKNSRKRSKQTRNRSTQNRNRSKQHRRSSYVYQGEPSKSKQAGQLSRKRRSSYLKRRYNETRKEAPFLHSYSRKSFTNKRGSRVKSSEARGRRQPRRSLPELTGSSLKNYVDHLHKTHDPQTHWIPPDFIDESYKLRSSKMRKLRGASNYRKYGPEFAPFCGPASGGVPNTFPVPDYRHYRAGLSRARNAPDGGKGVRECLYKVAEKKGWLRQSGDVWNKFTSKFPEKQERKSRHSRSKRKSKHSRIKSKRRQSRSSSHSKS